MMEHLTKINNQETQKKINRVLRSLYRFYLLKQDSSCPELIIDLESEVLKQAVSDLEFQDLKQISQLWNAYYVKNFVLDTNLRKLDLKQFKDYINSLN